MNSNENTPSSAMIAGVEVSVRAKDFIVIEAEFARKEAVVKPRFGENDNIVRSRRSR